MLKSSEQIDQDLSYSSKRMKSFYRECLLIINNYNEHYIKASLKTSRSYVRTYLKRRKESGDKKLYKSELKRERRYIKGLSYLIIKTKPNGRLKINSNI